MLDNQGVKACSDAVQFVCNAPDADAELESAAMGAAKYTSPDPVFMEERESIISRITQALTPAGLEEWSYTALEQAAKARDSDVDVDFSSEIVHSLDDRIVVMLEKIEASCIDAGKDGKPTISGAELVKGYVMCLFMGSSCNVVNDGSNVFILLPLLFRSGYLRDAQATLLGQCEFVRCTNHFMDDID